jgi:intracellular septation protein
MLQILELIPLVAFFVAYRMDGHTVTLGHFNYHFDGIYSATAVLMITTCLQVAITWVWKRKLEKLSLWLLATILVFGSTTLLLHNPLFIQWKPTVFNWVLGSMVLGSHFFTDKNIIQRILGQHLQLPDHVGKQLSYIWGIYFFLVGALNLVVAYHFAESTWVSYKLWSAVVYTLAISSITVLVISPHLKVNDADASSNPPDS